MHIRNSQRAADSLALQMTPMIDIVFQLLVFFIMTFRIVSQEGDFDIQMPRIADGGSPELLPLVLHLQADGRGGLAEISLNERRFARLDDLHAFVVGYIGDDEQRRGNTTLKIRADSELRYEFTVAALTAVRGRRRPDGGIDELIRDIRFEPTNSP